MRHLSARNIHVAFKRISFQQGFKVRMFKHTDGTSKREQQEDQGNKEAADFTQHLPSAKPLEFFGNQLLGSNFDKNFRTSEASPL